MKNFVFSLLLGLPLFLCNCASAPKFNEGIDGKFEVQDMNSICGRTGSRDTGIQCLRVSANHSNRDKAFGLAKKYAVAAVLLRGVSGQHSSTKNPLIALADQERHARWIQGFFDQGEYLKYLDQAEIEPNEVYTIKGGVRVGINAKVNYQRLNQRLIEEGLVKINAF
ncbi:MAG: hypothetical protein U0X91_27890 [Spirosomataceae bacterium]